MRGITFVLVPTLSLVNMGVNGASIGNILGQRGDGAKLGATTQAARQYHTADFSNSDSGAHKGAVAHRALLDTLTQSTVLSSADTGNSTPADGMTVQSVSPRVDVGQNEITALSEDVQNTATAIPRQLSFDAPSLTNSLAPNTISSGDGLTSVTGVDSVRRAENTVDNAAVCSKHKASLDTRALEITKTSAADPIDISNVDGGLALRAQHARQVLPVPPAVTGLPVVGPAVGGAIPRSVDARTLGLSVLAGSTGMLDFLIDNGVRDLAVTPTFNGKPILGEASLGSGTLPTASGIVTSISGLKEGSTPAVGTSDGNPVLPFGESGLPILSSLDGTSLPVIKTVGVNPVSCLEGTGLPALTFTPANSASPDARLPILSSPGASLVSAPGSSAPVVGSSGTNIVPIVGGGSGVPIVGNNIGNTGGTGSNSVPVFGGPASSSRSGTGSIGSSTAQDVVGKIVKNTARGFTDIPNSFPVLGSRTVKRDASITLNALQPSLTALFSRQEDTTSDASDDTADSTTDSGDAFDSIDEATSSTDAAIIARRQTSDSTDGTADSAEGTDTTGNSTDSADSADTLDSSDATTTSVTRRQATDGSSDASDSGDAAGDSTDSSDAGNAPDSSDAATASVTRRQSTDDSTDASDSTAGEATVSADSADSGDTSGSSDADATTSATRRQTTDESTDTSASSDASGDSTDSADSDDASGSDTSDATTVVVTRRLTTDDSTSASNSGDADGDSTDVANSGDASGSDSLDAAVTAARRQTTDDSADTSESSDASGDSGDSAETSGDSSDVSIAVKRRQDTGDSGSPPSEDATSNDENDASTTASADGGESTSTDSSEEAAARRRALGFKLTPSQLRNRMTMRKVRRQDNVDIDDADVDASSVSTDASNDAATDASATEESLDSLD